MGIHREPPVRAALNQVNHPKETGESPVSFFAEARSKGLRGSLEGSEAERKAPKGLADQAESDRKRPSAQALAERDSPKVRRSGKWDNRHVSLNQILLFRVKGDHFGVKVAPL